MRAPGAKKPGLVLTRKVGDAVFIGPEIIVEVVEIRGCQVRLRFVAPLAVNIARAEFGAPRSKEDSND